MNEVKDKSMINLVIRLNFMDGNEIDIPIINGILF